MKQAVVIYKDKKPIYVAEIKTYESTESFLKIEKEAMANLNAIEQENTELRKKVDDLVDEQRKQYGHILMLEGKITPKEFEDGKY